MFLANVSINLGKTIIEGWSELNCGHKQLYPDDVFNGKLDSLLSIQKLRIKPDAYPIIMPDRRVPISDHPAIHPKLKEEVNKFVEIGETDPVEARIMGKPGDLRIFLDPHDLNKVTLKEHYTLSPKTCYIY